MTTDNKTLADVQPGGRVRLGDQAERARFEAWWLSTGRTKNDLRKMEGEYIYEDSRYAWFGWKAALTPPEGFVLVEKSKLADSERLDFLDAMNVALNSHYGTNYGWRMILSPQITRLMCGQQHQGFVGDIDLNDQNGGRTGFLGCREAIDAAMGASA